MSENLAHDSLVITYDQTLGSLATSSSGQRSNVQPTPRSRSWHPKATPFRLLTTLSVAGLGTLKAILTYQGSQLAPVMIEWICGTLLFLVYYFLGVLEQDGQLNDDSYRWFYDYDCMESVWTFLEQLQIHRPDYSTAEISELNVFYSKPLITNYRLLVSVTVVAVGMLKAILAYLGRSDGATAVDWILGVVVMTGLYILGLYEVNDADLLPVLFTNNDYRLIGFISYEGILILLIFLMLYLFAFSLQFSKETFFSVVSENPVPLDFATADSISASCAGIIMLTGLTFMGYISLIPLLLAIFLLQRYFEPSAFVRRLMGAFLLKYGLNCLIPSTLPTFLRQEIAERGVFFLRSINHIILHIFALIVAPSMGVAFVALSLQFFSGGVFMGLCIMFIGLTIIVGIVPVVMSMFRPFYRIRQTGVWSGEGRNLGFFF